MIMLKLCAAALVSSVLIGLIRVCKPELTLEAVLCASVILLSCILSSVVHGFAYLEDIFTRITDSGSYFPVIVKALGISYLTDFTSALCQDAGEKAIAGKVELAGKIAVFFTAIPVFQSVLDMMDRLMQ